MGQDPEGARDRVSGSSDAPHLPRLSANLSMLFTEIALPSRFAAAAAVGFEAVEIQYPYECTIPELRRRLSDAGLRLVLINAPAGDADERGLACRPERRTEFRESIRRAVDYAAGLDCGLIHVLAGTPATDLAAGEAWRVYKDALRFAAEEAAKADIQILVEALNPQDAPGYLVSTQEDAAAVVRSLGTSRVALQFDVYHCALGEVDVVGRLETLLPLIAHVQIADAPGRGEPGTGAIDWDPVFRLLHDRAYSGWVGCEYRPQSGTVEGLSWRDRFKPALHAC